MMGYGIIVTPEDTARWQNEYFVYFEALIKAEQLNPDEDYDNVRETKLLKKIAIANLTQEQRTTLTILLLGNENDEQDED